MSSTQPLKSGCGRVAELIYVVATVLLTALSCSERQPAAKPLPKGLVVLSGATNIRSTQQNSGPVTYEVAESYPATVAIAELIRQMAGQGWRRRDYDVLNPHVSISDSRGWTEYEDRTNAREGPIQAYQWAAQWEDTNGTVAWYLLTYRADDKGDGTKPIPKGPLKVAAALLSPDAVKRMRNSLETAGSHR